MAKMLQLFSLNLYKLSCFFHYKLRLFSSIRIKSYSMYNTVTGKLASLRPSPFGPVLFQLPTLTNSFEFSMIDPRLIREIIQAKGSTSNRDRSRRS